MTAISSAVWDAEAATYPYLPANEHLNEAMMGVNDPKESNGFSGVKVFSATMAQDRDRLGDRITDWIRSNPAMEIVDTVVRQSSDHAFHCLTFCIFFRET